MFIPRRPSDFEFPKPNKRLPMPEVFPPKEELEFDDGRIVFLDNKPYVKEEDVLKFYYCKSEDDYYIGRRVANFYYAKYIKECKEFVWCMSRYLPWGEHITDESSPWEGYQYPSEPVEIGFTDWLKGFIQKYYP